MWSLGNEMLVSQRLVWIRLSSLLLLCLSHVLASQNKFHQNVTRRDGGDIFSNPDRTHCTTDSCYRHEGKEIGGLSHSSCECACTFENTFVVQNTTGTCKTRMELSSLLLKDLPGKDAEFRLSDLTTTQSCYSLPIARTLDITVASSRTLCLPYTDITKCHVLEQGSKYRYSGAWYPIWPPGLQQDTFSINETSTRSILTWKSDLGKPFTGLIFRLNISCQLKGSGSDTLESLLLFKSAGYHYFDSANRPTVLPPFPSTTPTTVSRSNTISSTVSPSQSDKGKSSKSNKAVVIGISVTAAILIIFFIIVLVFLFLRRRKNSIERNDKEAPSHANPTYGRGQERALPMAANEQTYDSPDNSTGYQPLVQNTRVRDTNGRAPTYAPLVRPTDEQPPRGHDYESITAPIQPPANPKESHDYEDPAKPASPDDGPLYAVSAPQEPRRDNGPINFDNAAYKEPDAVITLE